MTTRRSSLRCLSRRHLARISIIDRLGESSMNSGASETEVIVRARGFQSWSDNVPERILCSATRASAESSRMVISLRLISSENTADVSPCRMDADRQMSSAIVDLPAAGPGREDDHLAAVQAVGERVEVGEAGGHTDHRAAVGADRLDLVEGALQDLPERQVVLGGPSLGDGVDLGLRPVDDVVGLGVGVIAHLHDARAGLDQAAQDRALADDLGVEAGVRRGGDGGDEGVEVRRPADARELPRGEEGVRHRDRVGRLSAAVQVEHRLVDRLVGRLVEVGAAEHLDDVSDRVLGQQHPAEDALLREQVLRWLTVEPRLVAVSGVDLRDRHRSDCLLRPEGRRADERTGLREPGRALREPRTPDRSRPPHGPRGERNLASGVCPRKGRRPDSRGPEHPYQRPSAALLWMPVDAERRPCGGRADLPGDSHPQPVDNSGEHPDKSSQQWL